MMAAKIKDLKITEAGGSSSEIVTVEDVKNYLQIEGTAYDGQLSIFITAARQVIEQSYSVSLIEKTVVAIMDVTKPDPFRLPFYPVGSVTQVKWRKCPSTWVTLTPDEDYYTFGDESVYIDSSEVGLHEITYTLGVDPRTVYIQAIQAQVGYMFNNRDAKPGDVAPEVTALLSAFYTYA